MPATMLTGVIRGGQVELDIPADLPDGTRVRFVPLPDDGDDDTGPPPDEPYDRMTELQILRDSYADALAERGGIPHETFMAELRAEFGLTRPERKE